MCSREISTTNDTDKTKSLEHRLDSIGWGLFILMIGGLQLAPVGSFPESIWLFGAGAIIGIMSAIRVKNGLAINWFWVIAGTLAIIVSVSEMMGTEISIPVFPMLLIALAISILTDTVRKQRKENSNHFHPANR